MSREELPIPLVLLWMFSYLSLTQGSSNCLGSWDCGTGEDGADPETELVIAVGMVQECY